MSAIESQEESFNKIKEARKISHKFLTDILANSEKMNQSLSFEFYINRTGFELSTDIPHFPARKVLVTSGELVAIHNENVALFKNYYENFFELKNKIKLKLSFPAHLTANDIDQSLKYYTLGKKLYEDIMKFDNAIVDNYNTFDRVMNSGFSSEITDIQLRLLKKDISSLQTSFYNWMALNHNKILGFLKKFFPDNYRETKFISPLNKIGELETIKKEKEISRDSPDYQKEE